MAETVDDLTIQYEEDGVTPLPRDNGYENIVYLIENQLTTVYDLIDAGVVERFKISI